MLGQEVHGVVEQVGAFHRQGLHFIEHQHGPGQLVHTTRTPRTRAKQGLQQLHHGGVNDGCVPVFAQHLFAPGLLLGREAAVVFQHDTTSILRGIFGLQHIAHHLGVLVDDGGEGDDVDDAIQTAFLGVLQGKAQAGQGFSATRGHGQGIDASRPGPSLLAMQ